MAHPELTDCAAVLLIPSPMHPSSRHLWRTLQAITWLLSLGILCALFLWPEMGIHALWNVLIPVAPLLLAIAPGLWRNICPLASTALVLRHAGRSARKPVSSELQGHLLLIGVVLLFAIVPLRHVVLDLNGPATGLTLIGTALLAIFMGSRFEWKSGWCSGICPVHPVERLYGSSSLISLQNAHCSSCEQCVVPCADSTPRVDPLTARKGRSRTMAGTLMAGGFVGYIWGWFQVPDYSGSAGLAHLTQAYAWPLGGTLLTLIAYLALKPFAPPVLLRRSFAAAAIACYYWYRLPWLFGYGPFPGDGMLVDLTHTLGVWFPTLSRTVSTLFFAWWLVGRRETHRSWLIRPGLARPTGSD